MTNVIPLHGAAVPPCFLCGGPYRDENGGMCGCEFCPCLDARIPLWNREQDVVGHALVSVEDRARLSAHRWTLSLEGYAQRHDGGRVVYMDREVMRLNRGDGLEVDHVNDDTLDNRRDNLRVVSHAAERAHRGVYKIGDRWGAQSVLGGGTVYFGAFDRLAEAARAAATGRQDLLEKAARPGGRLPS